MKNIRTKWRILEGDIMDNIGMNWIIWYNREYFNELDTWLIENIKMRWRTLERNEKYSKEMEYMI